jgi:uncharacterized protein (UPF0332 family)
LSPDNIKKNVLEEIERTEELKKAYTLLSENGLYKDAVTKLYYYLLYHIRALLLTKELEPKSHEGALRLFSLYFVKDGKFEPMSAHTFSKLMKYREEADYTSSYLFTKEDFEQLKKETEDLSGLIRKHLREGRFVIE